MIGNQARARHYRILPDGNGIEDAGIVKIHNGTIMLEHKAKEAFLMEAVEK